MSLDLQKASSAGVGTRSSADQGAFLVHTVEECLELLRVVVGGISEVGHGRQQDIPRVLPLPAKGPLNPASQISLFQLNPNAATRADAHRTRTMSLEMCFWMVTDEQLSSFRERPGAFFAFSQSAPSEAGVVDNHRNVRDFHYLLNGTKSGASGPLRIFETCFRRCADLVIDDSVGGTPACGLDVADTRALLEHLLALPNTEIRARARSYGEMRARRERLWSWLRRPQIPIVAAEENDYVYLEECFANLREICRFAVVSNRGLVWQPG